MPHRRNPINAKSAGANGARHRGKRDNWQAKDTTGSGARNRAVATTPDRRKSVPGAWVQLSDLLEAKPWEAPGADPALREVFTAFLKADTEPGDGAVAILPGGETLLLLVEADGLLVRRNVPADELALFLTDATESA